ncbi:MAG: zinc-dependent alcohol dehydrogenase family protein [Gammaproteobacteria bacterium]|nr:zinc-dependent alcohol dehydrogenase family protein [Gammaproteobacteria bacterium]MCP5424018.1 zinc-dependent alcohol dehydrogenase family protein [Gammaproteobacteria bacterium]MCP5459549.1 zinc-dependent alcohol dehydrogenase family protein [Gammaproteobacteria bacterium]
MKAMIITDFGGPEVFAECDWPKPQPGVTEILVRVHATSVNPVDYKIRSAGSWAGVTPPAVIGYDVAGVVEAVGAGVKRFKIGDEVFYSPLIFGGQGSYAEYHVADESIVTFKPSNLSFTEAASLPLAGCTAWDAIAFMQLGPGQTVLIHAAAGGVGSLAVQIAKASGARVLGTCRAANQPMVRSLGADVVIDYRTEDFVEAALRETEGRGVDAVYDTVGGDTLARSIQAVRPHGKLASIVDTSGDLNGAYGKNLRLYFGFMERSGEKMEILRVLAERRQLRPVIDSLMPLNQVANAHRRLEAGGVSGKIVLQIHP